MENLYIFALNTKQSHLNEIKELKTHIQNREVKTLHGSYKGEIEYSYLARLEETEIQEIARRYKQESVIELGEYHPLLGRKAKLIFTDNSPAIELGYMKNVSKKEAMNSEAWTYDIEQNKYFLAK